MVPVRPEICCLTQRWGRLAVYGSRLPGPGTKLQGQGAVTPSLHLEVPDVQFVEPGHRSGIWQSLGWRVCGTADSGIWVLKGDARGHMLPANLECQDGIISKKTKLQSKPGVGVTLQTPAACSWILGTAVICSTMRAPPGFEEPRCIPTPAPATLQQHVPDTVALPLLHDAFRHPLLSTQTPQLFVPDDFNRTTFY